MTPSVFAIVPARSGSKGVPGKNLRPLEGKPLLAYSIEAARAASCVDRVFLSTDCAEIAAVGKESGAEVPQLRPTEIAGDVAPVSAAVRHLLSCVTESPDFILLLQPTSPFRTAADIDAAFKLLKERGGDAVVSVTEVSDHPFLCRKIDDGALVPFIESPLNTARRQDLPSAYTLNGAIYLIRTEVFLSSDSFFPEGTLAYVMPRERSVDIDTELDLEFAEFLLRRKGDS